MLLRLWIHVKRGEQPGQSAKGEADDVEIAAIDTGGWLKVRVLNAVSTSFVERVTGGDVRGNLLFAIGAHEYRRGAACTVDMEFAIQQPTDGDAGDDVVPAIT